MDALEVWGGVECSVVRIGSEIRNQLQETGHLTRENDIDLIAQLGIKTVRYPVLWETTQPTPGKYEWTWADRRLGPAARIGYPTDRRAGSSWFRPLLDPCARFGFPCVAS